MNRYARCTMVALLVASLAAPAFGDKYYLYTPSQAPGDEKSQAGDGVLVREIQIQKGDTLSGLSRKFSGKGYYYPQILLFNDIKNPDLIYAGESLKVPVSSDEQKHSGSRSKPAKPHGSKRTKAKKQDVNQADKKNAGKAAGSMKTRPMTEAGASTENTPSTAETRTDTKLFEKAMKAYRQDDCRTAIELFDRFLANNVSSLLAADASLYKAECFLKQAAQ